MEILKEIGTSMVKPIMVASAGFLTASITEIDYLNELLSDDFALTKDVIALIGGGIFFWKSIMMVVKTNREKDQAYKDKEIDIERKAWELAHDQKKANEEGLIEIIKELQETIKNSKK